jgi:hypothetical protein
VFINFLPTIPTREYKLHYISYFILFLLVISYANQ